jgi:RNA-directed DNA polymerase
MSLTTPSRIRELQRKLYIKAKQEPNYRFYSLYDKIYREDILAHAYELAKANQGAPGIDQQSFEEIESGGRQKWLAGLREELCQRTYQPQAVRRVMIPKANGGERPLADVRHGPLVLNYFGPQSQSKLRACNSGF